MKTSVATLALVVAALLLGSRPVSTHQSNANVDKDRLLTSVGEVTRFAFVNPHVAMYLRAPDLKGEAVEWYASGGSPRMYVPLGWSNKTFKGAEKILLQGHPLRDGRPIMQFQGLYRQK